MPTSYTPLQIAGVVVAIGVVTYAIRVSFIALWGYLDDVPDGLERALRYVPPAVFAALVLPALVGPGVTTGAVPVDKLLAGTVAAVVAWRTENIFATIVVGMVTLWAIRFLP